MTFILSFVLLFLSFTLHAVEVKVLYSKGKNYKITLNQIRSNLSKGSIIKPEETVVTSRTGFLVLSIDKHSTTRIEPQSKIRIIDLPQFSSESKKELEKGGSFFIEYGSALIDMAAEFDSEAMTIKTKNSTFGVRGTEFHVINDTDAVLSVNEGIVEIKNKLSNEVDFVTKGESLIVEKDRTFTARQKYDFQKQIDWNVKATKLKGHYRSFKKKLTSEFKLKRAKWKQDSKRLESFKSKWQERKKRHLKRREGRQVKRRAVKRETNTQTQIDRTQEEIRRKRRLQKRKRRLQNRAE